MTDRDLAPLLTLIADLEREATGEGPPTLRKLAAIGHEKMTELLEAVRSDNELLADEIMNGTTRENGSKRPDGIRQVLPYWARGTALLRELLAFVTVDESQRPVTVTVHWERVPAKRRNAVASLASELVDVYRGRPAGGRPPRSRRSSAAKPGDPDMGTLPL